MSKIQKPSGKAVPYILAAVLVVAAGAFAVVRYLGSRTSDTPASAPMASADTSAPAPSAGGAPPSDSSCASGPPLTLNINGQSVQTCGEPANGSVTAISGTSITVAVSGADARTFSITASTKISHQGQAITPAGIKVGDKVSVIASPDDAHQAQYILLNPKFQGEQ